MAKSSTWSVPVLVSICKVALEPGLHDAVNPDVPAGGCRRSMYFFQKETLPTSRWAAALGSSTKLCKPVAPAISIRISGKGAPSPWLGRMSPAPRELSPRHIQAIHSPGHLSRPCRSQRSGKSRFLLEEHATPRRAPEKKSRQERERGFEGEMLFFSFLSVSEPVAKKRMRTAQASLCLACDD